MQRRLALLVLSLLTACGSRPPQADPLSDAPESAPPSGPIPADAATYADALLRWQGPPDLNAWIGARFHYDHARALRLSETQRQRNGQLAIIEPAAFFAAPTGVCVDLARFAVESLRARHPATQAMYLMIEFDPVAIAGNTLRRHWLASYQGPGGRYFFADAKRPGHVAGPCASTQAFIDDYAHFRGRRIVAFSEGATYKRQMRSMAVRQDRAAPP